MIYDGWHCLESPSALQEPEENLDLAGEPNTYKGFLAANFTTKPSMNQTIEVTQRLVSYV